MPPLDDGVALILLAAGRSARFGSDKLTSAFRDRPLWQWAAQAAEDAGFRNLYLVTGPHSLVVAHAPWRTVVNPNTEYGMGTSIAAGVAAATAHRRIVIALADMPLVTPSHLRRLGESTGTVFTRQADGSAGSPAAFGRDVFAALCTLDGDRGARGLRFADAAILTPDAVSSLIDIDRPADLIG